MQSETKTNRQQQQKNAQRNLLQSKETNKINSIIHNYLRMSGATIAIIRLEVEFFCDLRNRLCVIYEMYLCTIRCGLTVADLKQFWTAVLFLNWSETENGTTHFTVIFNRCPFSHDMCSLFLSVRYTSNWKVFIHFCLYFFFRQLFSSTFFVNFILLVCHFESANRLAFENQKINSILFYWFYKIYCTMRSSSYSCMNFPCAYIMVRF